MPPKQKSRPKVKKAGRVPTKRRVQNGESAFLALPREIFAMIAWSANSPRIVANLMLTCIALLHELAPILYSNARYGSHEEVLRFISVCLSNTSKAIWRRFSIQHPFMLVKHLKMDFDFWLFGIAVTDSPRRKNWLNTLSDRICCFRNLQYLTISHDPICFQWALEALKQISPRIHIKHLRIIPASHPTRESKECFKPKSLSVEMWDYELELIMDMFDMVGFDTVFLSTTWPICPIPPFSSDFPRPPDLVLDAKEGLGEAAIIGKPKDEGLHFFLHSNNALCGPNFPVNGDHDPACPCNKQVIHHFRPTSTSRLRWTYRRSYPPGGSFHSCQAGEFDWPGFVARYGG